MKIYSTLDFILLIDETWQQGTIPTYSTKVVSMDEKENFESGPDRNEQFSWIRARLMSVLRFIGPNSNNELQCIDNSKKIQGYV